ncbi:MAG: ATP-binding protein [Ruminococcus sp.]|nr:ATP-binding protein [Ruminococcus sp.]
MSYPNSVVDKARDELHRRKTAAESEQAAHLEEIRERCPEIYQEQQKMAGTFFSVVKMFMTAKKTSDEFLNEVRDTNLETQQNIKRMLREKGYPEDYLDTKYTCPKCHDTGSVEGYNCECFRELLKRFSAQELSSSAINLKSFSQVRFDIYKDPAVKANMQKMASFFRRYCKDLKTSDVKRSLLLQGSTGTGKTFFSACIAGELIEQGIAVCFGSAFDFFRKAEDERFKGTQGDTVSTMIEADVLIIDDLGAEFKTKYTESTLYNVLDTRMNLSRPTIISTNLMRDDLRLAYGERVFSRLAGVFTPVYFPGADMRLELLKEKL